MAGTLKPPSPRKQLHHLALPGETQWEQWSFVSRTEGSLEKTLTVGELSKLPSGSRMALPVWQMNSVPLWLQTTDPSLFLEMIQVQLEKRGLWKSIGTNPPLYHHVVTQEPNRTLVFILLLDPRVQSDYILGQTADYDFSARSRLLPVDGFTIWKEEGRLALAFTRQGKLAHVQNLSSPEVTQAVANEILCLQLRLGWENVLVGETAAIHFYGEFLPAEHEMVSTTLHVKPFLLPRPVPIWRDIEAHLVPSEVTLVRKEREKSKRWRQLIGYAAWAYLTFLLVLLGQFGWLSFQAHRLASQVNQDIPAVNQLQTTSARWQALQPAIDSSYYPLETLLSCVNQLPTEARLTQFKHDPEKALVMGECQDAANAFKFLSGLQADPSLKHWNWNMPQPQLLPNNRAQFQLEGTHGHSSAQ